MMLSLPEDLFFDVKYLIMFIQYKKDTVEGKTLSIMKKEMGCKEKKGMR